MRQLEQKNIWNLLGGSVSSEPHFCIIHAGKNKTKQKQKNSTEVDRIIDVECLFKQTFFLSGFSRFLKLNTSNGEVAKT